MAHYSDNIDPARLVDARVHDAAGHEAVIASIQEAEGGAQAWVQLADGMRVLVPVDLLSRAEEDSFRVPFNFETAGADQAQMSFPVMEETLEVAKQRVDTGRGVRVHKQVTETERVLDEPLRRDELVVEHVSIGQVVSGTPPETRYEGDTLVVPVLEEVLVVQKQLMLKEEVRITRREQQVQEPQTVRLRSEQVTVERFDDSTNASVQPRQ